MKGFIIYEDYRGKKVVEAVKLGVVNYTCKSEDSDWVSELSGIRKTSTQAYCNKDDEYDFETGALIALMKMCGFDKSYKAIEEAFKYNSYDAKKSKELEKENNYLKYVISCRESAIKSLENTRNLLIDKNRELKKEKEQIIVAKNVLYNRLEKENEKLKTDCEKLQHGYIDTDMIFCGGRQNGKQYTFLKKLFKSIPRDKVEAAYKEAYNTELPVWQKEVLNQMYGVYKESKEKIELQGFHIESKPLRNDQLDSLIEGSIALTRKSFNEWLYGPQTKRAEMWNDILACGDCEHSKYVEVKKEDLEAFVKECDEKKIFNIIGYEFHPQGFWFYDDRCIFQIFRKPAGFICAKSVGFAHEDTIIDYLPPMRWDLFKKGRLAVKVNYYNYKEFCEACEKELGKKPSTYFWDNVAISICKKDGCFEIFTIEHQKSTGRKIVDWEDVREKTSTIEDPYDTWK